MLGNKTGQERIQQIHDALRSVNLEWAITLDNRRRVLTNIARHDTREDTPQIGRQFVTGEASLISRSRMRRHGWRRTGRWKVSSIFSLQLK